MPSWKAVQSKKQVAKKTRLALWVLTLVIILLFLAQAVKFTHTLFSPWKLSTSLGKNYSWDGALNLNLIVRSQKISLVSYSPQNQQITLIDLPDSLFFDTSHGFGKWQLGSVYGLGGDLLLKDSLSSLLGIPIDGVVEGDLADYIKRDNFPLFSFVGSLKTSLTLFELIRLQMGLSGVRFDKINKIDLVNGGILDKDTLADGSQVYTADPAKLDSVFTALSDPTFAKEHQTIAIFNATDHPQLAQKAARLITNLGGDVIITANGQNKYQNTKISGQKSKTFLRLKQIFQADDTIDPKSEDLVSSRARINLFLGEDYFKNQ